MGTAFVTQKRVMDRKHADDLAAWLDSVVPEDEQHDVEVRIHAALEAHPDLIAQGFSWREIEIMGLND